MYCKYCGKQQDDGAFCKYCGRKQLDEQPAPLSYAAEPSAPVTFEPEPPGLKARPNISAIIACASAGVIVICAALLLLHGSKDKLPADKDPDSSRDSAVSAADSSAAASASSEAKAESRAEASTAAVPESAPDTEIEHTVPEIFLPDTDDGWKDAYLQLLNDYQAEYLSGSYSDSDYISCGLYFADDDDIPELVITGGAVENPGRLYTYRDGETALLIETGGSYRENISFSNAKGKAYMTFSTGAGIQCTEYSLKNGKATENSSEFLEFDSPAYDTWAADVKVPMIINSLDHVEKSMERSSASPQQYIFELYNDYYELFNDVLVNKFNFDLYDGMKRHISFMYIDDDDIPEIWFSESVTGMSYLYTYSGGEFYSISEGFSARANAFHGYNEKGGQFMTYSSGGMSDWYYEIYEMHGSRATLMHRCGCTSAEDFNNPRYYIDDDTVSETECQDFIKRFQNKMTSPAYNYEEDEVYTFYDDIFLYIK